MTNALIRFTVLANDPDSGSTSGILVAAHTLRDESDLTVAAHGELHRALLWFNENPISPAILRRVKHRRAISWFKPAASQMSRRMWQLKSLLETHDLYVDVLRTVDPGHVIYEDELQVAAKPSKPKAC